MKPFLSLLELASPGPSVDDVTGTGTTANATSAPPTPTRAEQLALACTGLLGAVGLAAIWGVAANASAPHAVLNALKVPMLVIVSGAASLPITALVWKLTAGRAAKTTSLLVAYSAAAFAGTLVLALLSPIVALYQHSSAFAGPWVALGSAVVGFVGAACVFVRVLRKLGSREGMGQNLAVGLLLVIQLATLSQLASVLPPVFGQRTAFGRGVDGLRSHEPRP